MKKYNGLKIIWVILLITHPFTGLAQSVAANPNNTPATPAKESSYTSGKAMQKAEVKSAYPVDGRTSASVLAAQRSHTVAGQDEARFAIFSGLAVIGLIVFFTQIMFGDK